MSGSSRSPEAERWWGRGGAAWLLLVGAGAVGTEGPGPGPLGTGCGNVFRSAQLPIFYAWNKPDLAAFIATISLFSPNSWKTPPPSPVASAKPLGVTKHSPVPHFPQPLNPVDSTSDT